MELEMVAGKWLACFLVLTGFSLLYFGYFRAHWFFKKAKGQKPSFKDESYFWKVFPYGLFFSITGLMFITQPTAGSLMVAIGCTAWVQILFKYVN